MKVKEKRPQFLKMNANREDNPPPREVGCPDYRRCLAEAAFKNYCLDCSLCAAIEFQGHRPTAGGGTGIRNPGRITAEFALPG